MSNQRRPIDDGVVSYPYSLLYEVCTYPCSTLLNQPVVNEVSLLSTWELPRLKKLTVIIQIASFIGRNLLKLLNLLFRKRRHRDHLRRATRSKSVSIHLPGFKESLLLLFAHAFPFLIWDSIKNFLNFLLYFLLYFFP